MKNNVKITVKVTLIKNLFYSHLFKNYYFWGIKFLPLINKKVQIYLTNLNYPNF